MDGGRVNISSTTKEERMALEYISSTEYPLKPINTPAVKAGGFVFCSGQVGHGEIKAATQSAVRKLSDVLSLAGSNLNKVVKLNILLKDMSEFATMNEAIIQVLPEGPKPARTCVQVGKLPGGETSSIEIEAIALA